MVVFLSGGTGTPKLIEGFRHIVSDEEITVIVNTSDDIYWNGLYVSPDLDTIVYLFAGFLDTEKYWGIRNDTFNFLEQAKIYGLEKTWFNIGDRDLAIHVLRTYLMNKGLTLTEVTKYISRKLGIKARIYPMCNEHVETFVELLDGRVLNIQEYLVKYRFEPEVKRVFFRGLERAKAEKETLKAILDSELIIIGPSNPINSIGPILSVKGVKEALKEAKAPIIAVSPIISNRPISGPADKFMKAYGLDPSPLGIAKFYKGLIDGLVIDIADEALRLIIEKKFKIRVHVAKTVMESLSDKVALAREIMKFARTLGEERK